jgi:hypothetical protein
MTTGPAAGGTRCVHCKVAISVPEHYAHGDHIKCGACGTKHKVVRGEQLRLVLADAGPVRDAIALNEHTAARLEEDLARTRRGVGIGANGLAVGLAYAVYQVGIRHEPISRALLGEALGIALAIFALLELANWAFLGKRQRITTLTRELEEARAEGARLRTILRDATRV